MNHPTPKPVVLVLMGGPDAEREISVLSGREVAQALRRTGRFEVVEKTVTRPTADWLAELGGDVAFPVLHGRFGEGGPLQDRLEAAGLPYVGSGPGPARLAMDKQAGKRCVAEAGVPVLPHRRLEPDDACDLEPPLVLKPIDDGSSLDLRICHDPATVATGRAVLHPRRGAIMAERYVAGREVTVGIVNGRALPLIEIIPGADVTFYDYQAKYFRNDTRYVFDPSLPPGMASSCVEMALTAFNRIGCRDVARVDFIVDDGCPWFLEINTMPGFTTHSLVPMASARIGRPMPALCAALVDAALQRAGAPVAAGV